MNPAVLKKSPPAILCSNILLNESAVAHLLRPFRPDLSDLHDASQYSPPMDTLPSLCQLSSKFRSLTAPGRILERQITVSGGSCARKPNSRNLFGKLKNWIVPNGRLDVWLACTSRLCSNLPGLLHCHSRVRQSSAAKHSMTTANQRDGCHPPPP